METYVDLHIHTCFSDGTQSPEKVVAVAKDRGLAAISICDHNTIGAYDDLRPACASAGIELIQGAEFDVYLGDERLHILGYGFDPEDAGIKDLLRRSRAELDQISVEMIRDMEKAGEPVSSADYEAYEMPLGREGWKGINYLCDRGLSDGAMDAMRYHGKYHRYRPQFYSIEDACAAIRAAGGIPVLAHPGVYWMERKGEVPSKLSICRDRGLGGVECYYPWHDEEFTDLCLGFCEANDLRVTCGCDGHGDFGRVVKGVLYDIGLLKIEVSKLRLEDIYP